MKDIRLVDLKEQYNNIKEEIAISFEICLNSTNFIGGNEINTFEKNFASFLDSKYCVSCANGTDALEISLKALNIGEGDEVIVPAFSFVATSEAVNNIGANVVFCDIDENYFTIDPNLIEEKITSKTKAILPVHLYGQLADMNKILDIAEKNRLFIIEDSAQAHGAKYDKTFTGGFGDLATFSFFPSKNLGAFGDGGAIITNNEELALKCRKIANHGRVSKYDHEIIGRNSRLDTLQAAVLNVKLKYLAQWNNQRIKLANVYLSELEELKAVILPKRNKKCKSIYHLFVIRVNEKIRDDLKDYLLANGIRTGIHYPISLPNLKSYKYLNHKPSDFPVSYQLCKEVLSLPIYPELKEEQVMYVCENVKKYFEK